MEEARVHVLADVPPDGDGRFVLYWMEHSQRAHHNPALEHAVRKANALDLPVVVAFVVDPKYPEGNARHFTFMLEGLKETFRTCRERGLSTLLLKGSPPEEIARLARGAALLVTDRGYLNHLKDWRRAVAEESGRRLEMVEGDVVVPVDVVSDKRETAARTIRPKVNRRREDFLSLPSPTAPKRTAGDPRALDLPAGESLEDVAAFVEGLCTDASVPPVAGFTGGTGEARRRLSHFLGERLSAYGEGRSDIARRVTSEISPYLHLGQISPVEIVRKLQDSNGGGRDDKETFLEEMIVRRELAINYVEHEPRYDRYEALPEWARRTLEEHEADPRPAILSRADIEAGRTPDRYFNAAMKEMRETGYLHNYMRMYWGKQIITWCATAREAFRTTLYLNNKYFLDGRDANSYANVGWLYGVHDRGWPEREIWGKVRSMKASGLERKFDVEAYLAYVDRL